MARTINRLAVKQVESLPAGKYDDGGGLSLVKSDRNTGKWVARVSVAGRRRELGLGSIHHTSLSQARAMARAAQSRALEDHDPIAEKHERLRALEARSPAFADVLGR